MDKKRLMAILRKLTEWVLFVVKYVVYFAKFIFWETKRLVQKYPKYSAIAGAIIVLLIIGTPFSKQIIKILNAPRPLPLTTASKNSGYQFAAKDNRTKFSALIGDAKTNTPKVSATFADGATMSFVMTGLNQNISKPSKSGNKVIFTDVRNAMDVEYQTLTTGIKENIILKQPQQGNAISFTLDTFGATPKKIAPETYGTAFYDNTGRYIFHFAKPYAVDAKGARTDNAVLAIHKTDKDTNYTATIIINEKWLADPSRVYPISVDPTVNYSVYSDVSAGQFNRITDTGSNSSLPSATGGTITSVGDYTVHTFTASGTFTPAGAGNVEILVVGGGGGGAGGASGGGGGGGGGGIIYNAAYAVTAQAYTVTVGTGGPVGTNGNDSVFDQLTAVGGGKGGAYQTSGSTGGSGGGSGRDTTTATGGPGTSGQGSAGGKATATTYGSAGGGGGAGGAGYNGGADNVAQTGTLSNGGIGLAYSISGTPTYYGGGAGGAWITGAVRAAGGLGGGGAGGGDGIGAAVAGTANTGGGGGGDRLSGAAGGSGVVIIRYKPVNTNLTTYYQELNRDANTVGLWHMNESSGTTTVSDASGNGNTGTSTSSTNVVTGILGNARKFNGTSDYINVGSGTSLRPTIITAEAWVNPNSTAGTQDAAAQYITSNTWILRTSQGDGHFWPYVNLGGTWYTCDGGVIPINQWSHVALTYDGETLAGYVNGTAVCQNSSPSGNLVITGITTIGSMGTPGEFFSGTIDEVRISNVVRSAEEIRLDAQRRPYGVYTSEVIPLNSVITGWNSMKWTELGVATGDGETLSNSANLVAQWNFNETSGTAASNAAGSCGASCNGTLVNFASTGSQDAAPSTGWTSAYKRWGAGALMFDGTNDTVSLGTESNYDFERTSSLSLEGWIKTSSATQQVILSKLDSAAPNSGYEWWLNSTGTLCFELVNTWATNLLYECTSKVVNDGMWHHVAVTYGGTSTPSGITIYIDGISQSLTTTYNTLSASVLNNITPYIGSRNNASFFFNGVIDSTRVYSRVLTSAEVLSDYNAGNVEVQTRVGNSTDPNDGSWEDWKPATSESPVDNLNSSTTLPSGCSASGGTTTDGGNAFIFTTGKTIFAYTGADQTYTVPTGVTSLNIKMWGGGGGGGAVGGWTYGFNGGGGGYTTGTLAVTPGQVLTVMVGAGGTAGTNANRDWNYGNGARSCNTGSDCRYGGQGGGASAVFSNGYTTPLLVAGGGGGGGSSRATNGEQGGAGGGTNGVAGSSYTASCGGGGATQSAGGAGGSCGTVGGAGSYFWGGVPGSNAYGGSGGGGLYGGGGGAYLETNDMGGGGGGSGYIGGAGVTSATTTAGSGITQANSGDADNGGYGAGGAGAAAPNNGVPGKVVITPVQATQSLTCTTGGNVEVLVVAGGGGGGTNMGGGGGGGGVLYNPSYAVTANTPVSISVGAGGMGAPSGYYGGHPLYAGTNGENSVFGTMTAIGGGRGGTSYNNMGLGIQTGAAGGSGGGATGYNNDAQAAGAVTGGAGTAGQGFAGGNEGNAYYSGGGGGAGGVGASGNSQANGGPGIYNDILGTGYYWGGGGGGAGYTICGGNGGVGGGGGGAACVTSGGNGLNPGSPGGVGINAAQTNVQGGDGGASTGGGGGAGGHYNYNNKAGNGGSGIVVVRVSRLTTDTTTKTEGTGSQQLTRGIPQDDANTIGLWHLDETGGTGAYLKNSSVNTKSAYTCTGANQTYTVPTGVTSIHAKMWGAGGGAGNLGGWTYGFPGGGGGFSAGDIAVTPGQQLTVVAGCGGSKGSVANTTNSYGGGGLSCGGTDCQYGGQGGGYSGIHNQAGTALIIAGGGGGGGASRSTWPLNSGGAGGGTTGQAGTSYTQSCAGGGGTQSAGGAGGSCATYPGTAGVQWYGGHPPSPYSYGGGGGGGWYGGGGGGYQESNDMGGAGGGSGYIGGAGITNAITLQGRGRAQAAVNDPDNAGAGLGGQNQAGLVANGQTGRVVITANASVGNGTPTGTTVVSGVAGKARSFNGTSDHIAMSNPEEGSVNGDITVEMWIKPTNFSATMTPIHKDSEYTFQIDTSGNVYWADSSNYSYAAFGATNVGLVAGQWQHLAFTKTNGTVNIYLNGVNKSSKAFGGPITPSGNLLNIGCYSGATTCSQAYFNGSLDEIKISNLARSGEEIAEDYRAGRDYRITRTLPASTDLSAAQKLAFTIAADRPGTYLEATIGNSAFANYVPDANTVGFWHLDEINGSGTCCRDSSQYRNNVSGTAGSLPTFQGKIGLARAFDGATTQMSVTNNSSLDFGSGNFTIDWWEYRTDATNSKTSMQRDYSADGIGYTPWMAGYANANNLYFYATSCGSVCTWDVANAKPMGPLLLNQWVYLAVTRNGNTFTTYENGVAQSTWTSALAIQGATGNGNFVIGQYWTTCTSGSYCFKGLLDEVRLSKAAYSAADIRAAYEYGQRTHEITIDFAAKLDSGNLIADSSDTSFTVDATAYGLSQKGSNVYPGDNIIVRENYGGTTYMAQATVSAVLASTGAVTVSPWKSGSTFPSSGFTANADVFKWQQEYLDLGGNVSTNRNAVTRLTLRATNGQEGRTIWLDDLRSVGNYLTNPAGSTITSTTADLYAQYRLIFSTSDYNVNSSVTSATLDFTTNAPNPPTIGAASNITTSSIQWNFTGTGGGTDTAGFALFNSANATVSANVVCVPGSCTESNLTPNTQYTRKAIAFNSSSQNSLFSHAVSAFTLAETPPAATPSAANSTTMSLVSLSAGYSNPTNTQLAIYLQTGSTTCTGTGGYYLAADGSNNSSAAVWQTASAWTSSLQPITGLNFETTEYTVCVKARNGASIPVETAWAGNATNAGFLPISGTFTMVGNTTFASGSKFTDGRSPSRYIEGLDSGPAGFWTFNEASLTSNGETPYNPNGLLGQWSMNEASGTTTVADSSGGSNTGTSVSSTDVGAGEFNNARTFNGTSDSISIANPSNFNFERTNSFTTEFWIKSTQATADLVSKLITAAPNNGYEVFMSSGLIYIYLINTWPTNTLMVSAPTAVNNGAWHHIAVTYAGTSAPSGIHIYIDGVDQTLTTVYNTLSASIVNSVNVTLGSRNGIAGNGLFNGSLDEVRIYNRVLAATEIAGIAKGYFADSSDLLNHGTPYGATVTTGKYGNAASFDGTNVIKMGNVINMGLGDFTIDAWIKTTATGTLVIAKDWTSPGYYCGVSQSKFYCGIDSGSNHPVTTGRTVINDNAWHHMAGVFDRTGKITVYVDGVQDNPTNELADISGLAGTDITSADYLCVGGNCSSGGTSVGNYLTGQVDEVHIYNTALSKYQILQDMNNLNQPQNVSKMILSKGVLTVLANETVAVGSFTFPNGSQASIALPADKTGQIKPGAAIWVVDADKDGYFASSNEYYGARPTGGRRRLTFSTLGSNHLDCNDNNPTTTINTLTIYPDTDGDGYGYGSASQVLGCTQAPSGYSLNNTDCGPSNANAYPGSTYCSTGTFTNTSSAQSYDWNCSASGGAGTACGTTYYTSGTVACSYAAVCGIYSNTCCSTANCTFNTTGVACGATGNANGASTLVYPDCVNPVTYYSAGVAGTQACN